VQIPSVGAKRLNYTGKRGAITTGKSLKWGVLGGGRGGGWGRGGLHGVVAKPDVCFRPTSLREWPENGGGLRGRLSIYTVFRGFRRFWGSK
jgi:hypothetical protein